MADFNFSEFYLEDLNGAEPPATHQRFADMARHLKEVAPPGRLPGRQHLDPCGFPTLLSLLNLVDVERQDGEMRFRFRLVGDQQDRAAGRKIKGLLVDEAVVPELVARINANMRRVVETRVPLYDRFPMPHPNRQFIDSERMYYPLASDGETVDMILILNGYENLPQVASIWTA
ncbi:PAS domain-containing protein [Pelagibius marinus]|uniref:PAS domain-containing protein n=1 Tax=Pelagibius marinus TaxID=2762760 RepID=UPI001872A68F|nr:PAS domain-containing protein [Pelagibius marinus]